MMLRLISATPSPFARKVRIALHEKGLPFELLTEVPWDKSTSTPRYNPLEKGDPLHRLGARQTVARQHLHRGSPLF